MLLVRYAKLHGSYEAATNCHEEDTLEDVMELAFGACRKDEVD